MKEATREAFGKTLLKLALRCKNIVTIDADLSESTKTKEFALLYPNRAYNCGIAEANMISIAAGFSVAGKIPFACSFAVFVPGRAYDQIRISVAYSRANVKLIGSHGGILTGEDGASHQALEDFALMRVLPNMKVFSPSDAVETEKMIEEVVKDNGPSYIRLCRAKTEVFHKKNYKFKIGRGDKILSGKHVSIITTGPLTAEAIKASKYLREKNILPEIINISTIKPIDKDMIIKSASKTRFVVTAEDHQISGGLGGAVCEVLSEKKPTKVLRIGMEDKFGQSGTTDDLYDRYGFTGRQIAEKIIKFIGKH